MKEKKIKIPANAPILDPAMMRAKAVAKAEEERLNRIVDRIIEILMEEGVVIKEISTILNMVDARIGRDIGKKELTEFYGKGDRQKEGK